MKRLKFVRRQPVSLIFIICETLFNHSTAHFRHAIPGSTKRYGFPEQPPRWLQSRPHRPRFKEGDDVTCMVHDGDWVLGTVTKTHSNARTPMPHGHVGFWIEHSSQTHPYEITSSHGVCIAPEDNDWCVRKRRESDEKCPLATSDGEAVCGECIFCSSQRMRACKKPPVEDSDDIEVNTSVLRFKIGDVVETYFARECDCGNPRCQNGAKQWRKGVVLRRAIRYKDVRAQALPLGGCYVYPYMLFMLDVEDTERNRRDENMTAWIPYDNSSTIRRMLTADEIKTVHKAMHTKPCGGFETETETVDVPNPLPDFAKYVSAN